MLGLLFFNGYWFAVRRLWCANVGPWAELLVCAGEDCGGFFGKFDFPALDEDVEDAQGSASAEPAFSYFFEVFDAMDDISFGVLFGEIEEVNGAGGVGDVDDDVWDLPKTV